MKCLFRVIIISFIVLTSALSSYSQPVEKGFNLIFNGKDLTGWKGDSTYWRVENNTLIGEVTPATLLKKNSFIIYQGEMPSDFELKVECRVSAKGNSGINYRSTKVTDEPFALKGYQADIDGPDKYSGQNYEERGRKFLALRGQRTIITETGEVKPLDSLGSKSDLQKHIKKEDWNEYHLIIKGNHLQHYINGILMSDVTDEDAANRTFNGYLGVQVHVGPPMKIEYRNFRLKKL